MAKFILSIGMINKKIYLVLIYIGIQIFMNIYSFYDISNEVTSYLNYLGTSIGKISSFFIGNILKYKRKNMKNKNKTLKEYIKYYFILFLICALYSISEFFWLYFGEDEDGNNRHYKVLFVNDALELILFTFVTYFLLKYKYYIHHIISIIIFIILNIIIDIVLNNYDNINIYIILTSLLYIIVDILYYNYLKYLMEVKYYFFMDILFINGVLEFIIYSITLVINIITDNIKGSKKIIFSFFEFYNEYGVSKMIINFLIGYIVSGIFNYIIEFATINEMTPVYLIVGYEIAKIPSSMIEIEGSKKWIILIITIFEIIILLLYLEILEYNFCSLNRNTKKNIIEREKRQNVLNDDDKDDEIDIKGYDISEGIKNQEKDFDMIRQDEGSEEFD